MQAMAGKAQDAIESFWEGETTGMVGLAKSLGLEHCETVADETYAKEGWSLPTVGILAEHGPEAATGLVYGRHEGCNVQLFNYDLATFAADPGRTARSCMLLAFAAAFPRVAIGRHTRMSRLNLQANPRWLDFTPPEFRDRFRVEAPDNDVARSILGGDLIEWLTGGRDDAHLELDGGMLLAHAPRLEDETWPEFIEYVMGFHARIPDEAWVAYGAFGPG